jgi:hypothetical protein
MKLMMTIVAAACALTIAQSYAQLGPAAPTVPGTVRADPSGQSSAPGDSSTRPDADGSDRESVIPPVRTDNEPIRDSDLTQQSTKYPPVPSLRPWAPTTTGNAAVKAPPQ